MKPNQTFTIYDSEYDTSYTAHIQKNGSGWMGWIQEHPKVRCEEETKEILLETLENMLYETLEADWETWDKQIEADIKAGRLDRLRDEYIQHLR